MITTSWKEKISTELTNNGESWEDVIFMTLTEEELNHEFAMGIFEVNGKFEKYEPSTKEFSLWTHRYVYFPIEFEQYEGIGDDVFVGSALRNPCNTKTNILVYG